MRVRRWAACVAATALLAPACGDDDQPVVEEPTATATDVITDTPAGVTAEPCPEAVNEDNGCIYLGVLSDLSQGPFTALATEIVAGQEAFWRQVNDEGGIGGYDIDLGEYARDNRFDPEQHRIAYEEIASDVLALAQSLGASTTLAIVDGLAHDDMIAVPASWWSGFTTPDVDEGLVLESGVSYCVGSMTGLDWFTSHHGKPTTVMAVGFDDLYGRDVAAGVEAWAAANDAVYAGFEPVEPSTEDAPPSAAVDAILQASPRPDVVALGTGPRETGQIIAAAVARGFEGRFLGQGPTWTPALISDEVDESTRTAILERFVQVAPWPSWGADTDAHRAMAAAAGDETPTNNGFAYGWISSYPMRALLEAAVAADDLSRQGLVAAADGLVVDYQGALPTRTFGSQDLGPPPVVSILDPDPEAPMGLFNFETAFTGTTAVETPPPLPCAAPEDS